MRFKYLRDPLFLFCIALYAINRFGLKTVFPDGFFHNYLNDVICIPFWVPIMLWGLRVAGLRPGDAPPRWDEIILPLVCWSVIFELVVPHLTVFRGYAVADAMDICCYTAGAVFAALFWERFYRPAAIHSQVAEKLTPNPSDNRNFMISNRHRKR